MTNAMMTIYSAIRMRRKYSLKTGTRKIHSRILRKMMMNCLRKIVKMTKHLPILRRKMMMN